MDQIKNVDNFSGEIKESLKDILQSLLILTKLAAEDNKQK